MKEENYETIRCRKNWNWAILAVNSAGNRGLSTDITENQK